MKKNSIPKNQSKIEIALKESEQRYRTTMMSVGDGVISTNAEGRVEMMNSVAEELTGWKQEEARSKSLEKIFHIINEETRKTVENPVHRVMHEGLVVGLANHTVLIARDGKEHPIADSGAPIRNEKGDIAGVVLVFRDQTKERMAQKALQESEAKYKSLFENAQVGMYRSRIDGSALLDVNKKFGEILGLTREESLGKAGRILWADPEDRNKMMKLLKEQGGNLYNYEARLLAKNGEIRDVLASIELNPDEGSLDGTFVDITERKRAEEVIKDNEKRFRDIIESLPQLFWTCSFDGPCDYLSRQWVEYTGIPESEQLGYRWLEQLHPEDRDVTVSEWMENVKTGNSFDIKFRIRRNDGVYLWFKTTAVPMRDAEGNIIKWFGSNTDIDEIKKTKEHLRKLNRTYSLLSDINQAIVRTRVQEELFEKVCNIAVGQGGFALTWVGLIDESSQKLKVIAQAGRTIGYLEHIDISLNDEPLTYCPIDSALRQGNHMICNISENEEMAPCQKIAYELGFRSSASFPLQVSGILKGALTFYSDEQEFFDEEEIKLLDELALDISFAMEFAEKEAGRKRVEEALHESEVRFRIAAETSNDVVYEWDLKQEVKWFGKVDEMLGYAPGEFPRTLDGLGASVHPDDWVRVMAAVQAHLEGRAPYAEDYRVLMKDGSFRWWSARGTVDRTADGNPIRWVGTVTDITERRLAEEILQESEAKYRTLVENIPQGIFMKDRNYKWVSINENFARNLGVLPEDIVGKVDRDLFPKAIADKYHTDDIRIIEKGQTEEFEEESILDGKHVWVNTIKTPVRDKNGEIVGVLGIFWDITERKKSEESLSIQKRIGDIFLTVPDDEMFYEVLKVILDLMQSPFGVFGYLDEAGALVVPTMTRQIWDKCQVPEKTFTFPRDTWGNSSWPRAIKEKKTNYSNEVSTKTPEGHITLTRHISLPILFQGEVIGLFQVANKETDYTDADINTLESLADYVAPVLNARLQQQLREKEVHQLNFELEDRVVKRTTQLEASNKELEAFSYSVSHDLRAPLRHVSGYVELLNKRFQSELPEKGQHYLNSIADSVSIMGSLIDDLLQFSRTGRMEMSQTNFDMNEVVKEAIESLCKDNPDRKISWALGKLPSVNGDEAMFRLVWMNLLSNAVKFTRTRQKARIEIGVHKEKTELVFFIRDNGVGFDMKYAQKLFGVFQRLHPAEEFEGTGIGLANVQRIILRHGGRTWAEAETDKGAVVYFSIPKNKEEI